MIVNFTANFMLKVTTNWGSTVLSQLVNVLKGLRLIYRLEVGLI